MAMRVTEARDARLAASPLPRACIALTKETPRSLGWMLVRCLLVWSGGVGRVGEGGWMVWVQTIPVFGLFVAWSDSPVLIAQYSQNFSRVF